jgi:hypothetical protein
VVLFWRTKQCTNNNKRRDKRRHKRERGVLPTFMVHGFILLNHSHTGTPGYNHHDDVCTACLQEANKDIRVTLSNGYTEDFLLLQQDGDQYFNFLQAIESITWLKITVLTLNATVTIIRMVLPIWHPKL